MTSHPTFAAESMNLTFAESVFISLNLFQIFKLYNKSHIRLRKINSESLAFLKGQIGHPDWWESSYAIERENIFENFNFWSILYMFWYIIDFIPHL